VQNLVECVPVDLVQVGKVGISSPSSWLPKTRAGSCEKGLGQDQSTTDEVGGFGFGSPQKASQIVNSC